MNFSTASRETKAWLRRFQAKAKSAKQDAKRPALFHLVYVSPNTDTVQCEVFQTFKGLQTFLSEVLRDNPNSYVFIFEGHRLLTAKGRDPEIVQACGSRVPIHSDLTEIPLSVDGWMGTDILD